MWEGEERRKGNREILNGFKDNMSELKTEVATLVERLKNWTDMTDEYRKRQCEKMDKLFELFGQLPCRERKGWYESMSRQTKLLWGAFAVTCLVLLIDIIKFHMH